MQARAWLETTGLPGAGTECRSAQQAQKVVGAHRRGLWGRVGWASRRQLAAPGRAAKRKSGASTEASETKKARRRWRLPIISAPSSEAEAGADRAYTPVQPRGSGVLSALLQLYDAADASSHTLAPTSTRSSFDGGGGSYFPATRTRDKAERRAREEERRRAKAERAAAAAEGERPRWAGSANGSAVSLTLLKISIPRPWGESRPPQARNAAGVFGPLIVSTGNIAGAAAPQHSTLAPSVKQPRYHLSWYLLESNLLQTKEVIKEPETALTWPQSMHFNLPGHSPSEPMHLSHLWTLSLLMNFIMEEEDDSPQSTKSGQTKWTGMLHDLPKHGWSQVGTPSMPSTPTTSDDKWFECEKEHIKQAEEHEQRKKEPKKAEIYMHHRGHYLMTLSGTCWYHFNK
ncbi:hypothetical protein WOLCODRAFT_155584 [Wolfiporia cocos MD-104 SS10]|uniref:Uncharacterized protein n=1 Tax=Wolfiporia cocos (strain MD-104) TaxID=742152 RepID=A0A2H3JFZ7_WOLCO|nr:hypothetical protein WOLCODRAFT_155584 [Wolfiporia cocos MD-104 SS10]